MIDNKFNDKKLFMDSKNEFVTLSVIVPCFNEVSTINKIINKIKASPVDKEIIIVDDGSSDGSKEFLSNIDDPGVKVIFHSHNIGKGAAIRTGIKHATGKILIIQDADLEYDPKEYEKII